jgi:hypothetical protein
MPRLVERLLIVIVSLTISVGVIALLSGGLLAGRDDPGVSGISAGPGLRLPDQGDEILHDGELEPVYDSTPPTSGPHVPAAVLRDGAQLTNDQLLSALAAGDVVFMYGSPAPPQGLTALARLIAPFTPRLAAQGQAVVLATRPGVRGVVALAWTHMLTVGAGGGAALRSFAQFWLSRGVTGR